LVPTSLQAIEYDSTTDLLIGLVVNQNGFDIATVNYTTGLATALNIIPSEIRFFDSICAFDDSKRLYYVSLNMGFLYTVSMNDYTIINNVNDGDAYDELDFYPES